MLPEVSLATPTREDVQRLADWLDDPDVNSFWYGLGEDNAPLHTGYSPRQILSSPEDEWQRVFEDEDRKIYSVYTKSGDHIGEAQLVLERPLQEAQLYLLIGRKDLWHQHYGTMAMIRLLDQAYETLALHRVWVDVPEYNEPALQICRHLGFVLEGHMRKTHPKDGKWYDSYAMGLLTDEYNRRRARLMGSAAQ